MAVGVRATATSTTYITCIFDGLGAIENPRTVTWYLDGVEYKTETGSGSKLSYTCTFTGLEPDTAYDIMVNMTTPSGFDRDYYPEEEIRTEAISYDHTLRFTCTTTANSITATVTLTSGYASYDIDAAFYLDGARALECDIPAGSLTRSRTWSTNIVPGTEYRVTLEDKLRGLEWYLDVITKNDFSWAETVASGKEFNIKAAGTGGWNDFTSQLKTKEQFHTGTNRTFTTAVKGGNFTAAMFNQAVNAINNLVSNGADGCVTRMSTVSKDDPITAAAINQLANCLNE